MTKERREEVLLVALVVSVAVHIALMFFVRSQVMTRAGVAKTVRREPMRVTDRAPRPSPAKIEEIMDLKAVKDAPPARDMAGTPLPSADSMETPVAEKKVEAPRIEAEAPSAPDEIAVTKFATRPPSATPRPPMPMTRIETPRMKETPAAPEFSVLVPSAAKEIAAPSLASLAAPAPAGADRLGVAEREAEAVNFTPASAVYEKVDAAVVAEEKAAVRNLVNAPETADLQKFVNLTMTSSEADGWRYFKVMMTPRTSLAVVPKDVVLVIDGSGSIVNRKGSLLGLPTGRAEDHALVHEFGRPLQSRRLSERIFLRIQELAGVHGGELCRRGQVAQPPDCARADGRLLDDQLGPHAAARSEASPRRACRHGR